MSTDEEDLSALFDAGRREHPPRVLEGQRRICERLALGGLFALLIARAAALPRVVRYGTLFGACMILAGAVMVSHRSAPVTPASPVVVATPVIAPAVESVPTTQAPVPVVSIDELPTVAPPASARHEERSLDRETRSLAHIRSLVDASDFTGAQSALREHRRIFEHGILDQEATVLEIESLVGNHDPRGCSVGRTFLDTHPGSAHRTRVTTLLRACED